MKKVWTILGVLLIVGILAYFIIRSNSLIIAIHNAGYETRNIICLENGFNTNNKQFKVIKTTTHSDLTALAYMEKNHFGFWTHKHSSTQTKKDDMFAVILWVDSAGFKRFNYDDDIDFETEWHYLYYGENAIKLIELNEQQLPFGFSVNINQAGETYSIHLTSCQNTDVLNKINMQDILLKGKFIK